MKYIKTYEAKKYKKNDLVVCTRKDLISHTKPLYGETYQVYKTSSDYSGAIYLKVKNIDTKEDLGWWNSEVFIPELEWSAKQYNI